MRKRFIQSLFKTVGCVALAATITLTGAQIPGMAFWEKILGTDGAVTVSEAATVTSRLPIICYPIANTNFRSYNAVNGKEVGWIYPADRCVIRKMINSNGTSWVLVSYPTSSGTKTRYALGSNFFVNTSFLNSTVRSNYSRTVYTKRNCATLLGTAYSSDYLTVIGTLGCNTQIIYPLSGGGYKMGFIKGTINTGMVNIQGGTVGGSSSSISTTAQKIVDYELTQIGVGDTKGDNNVKYNTWFYNRMVSGSGYAWCMAFQAYCCNQITGSNNAIPRTASCTSAMNRFKNQRRFYYSRYYGGSYTPKTGDLVFYTNGSKNASCHVGMITTTPINGYLQTIEGNIYCSGGNYKVVRFTKNSKRTVSNSYVLGYATPAY